MTDYPGADKRAQWFANAYPGARMTPNVVVLHTTEGGTWPTYAGGATAPTLTIRPDMAAKRLDIRQHFGLETSARALRNTAGGVETNTLNVIQIELVGTCDPKFRTGKGMFWPNAPEWALRELGEVLATLHRLFPGIPLTAYAAAQWLPYPASYGTARGQRMTAAQWRDFRGVCGHQHVPENDHGDPGALPISRVMAFALAASRPSSSSSSSSKPPAKPSATTPTAAGPTDVTRARALLGRAYKNPGASVRRRARIAAGLKLLPPR